MSFRQYLGRWQSLIYCLTHYNKHSDDSVGNFNPNQTRVAFPIITVVVGVSGWSIQLFRA